MNGNIIFATCVATLVACGGSSSPEATSNNTIVTNTPTAALTIKAVYIDACGNAINASDAALIIHNADYSNKQIITADANGTMSYDSSNDTETISIILRPGDEMSGIKPFEIITYVDHPVIDMNTVETRVSDDSLCNCSQTNLSVHIPARPADIGSADFFGSRQATYISNFAGYSEISGVAFCSKVDEQPRLFSTLVDYSYPDESYATVIENIQQSSSVSATVQGQPVQIVSPASIRHVSSIFDNYNHVTSYSDNLATNVYSYALEQTEFYAISAFNFEDIYDVPGVDYAYIFSYSYVNTTNINQTFDLPLLEINYAELFEVLTSETGSYAMSNTNELDAVNVGVSVFNYEGSIVDWYIYAPTSGQVPKIENLDLSAFISDEELDARTESVSMAVGARNYVGISGYHDLLSSRVNRKDSDFIQDKWNKMDWINFRVSMSGVGISQAVNSFSDKLENIEKEIAGGQHKPAKKYGTPERIKKELALLR